MAAAASKVNGCLSVKKSEEGFFKSFKKKPRGFVAVHVGELNKTLFFFFFASRRVGRMDATLPRNALKCQGSKNVPSSHVCVTVDSVDSLSTKRKLERKLKPNVT